MEISETSAHLINSFLMNSKTPMVQKEADKEQSLVSSASTEREAIKVIKKEEKPIKVFAAL